MVRQRDDLQIDTDERFLRREWRIQRVGWAVMGLVVVMAATGLFANGPLSKARAGSADAGFEVSYERFARNTASTVLEFTVGQAVIQEGQVHLWISQDYLQAVEVLSVQPEPSSVSADAEGVTFTLDVGDAAPVPVAMFVRPAEMGRYSGEVGTRDGGRWRIAQFIYP